MRITDLLKPEGIKLGGSATDKMDAINQMVDLMAKEGNVTDKEKYKAAVIAREQESTTGIGDGIAIPHAKTDAVKAPGLAAMTLPNGVDYEAPDGEPSNIIFLIADRIRKRTFIWKFFPVFPCCSWMMISQIL